jgi:protein-L-isoaspartate(D-aspartate) O-methyltransferase
MTRRLTILLAMAMTTLFSPGDGDGAPNDDYAAARAALVREIEQNVRETRDYLGKDALDPRVMTAIGQVPRHEFVPEALRDVAYINRPLPIGHEQTISQPYIVAIMTDLLGVFEGGRVLEVGTGSGYQAAVLGELCEAVYSIEIVEPLGLEAKALLARIGYDNVHVRIGDGFAGWPDAAPFDGIIVTAAADEVPPPLLAQLKPGGRMIIPVGSRFGGQDLLLIEKDDQGDVSRRDILPVLFVPLTRDTD